MKTDCDFLSEILQDHEWHSTAELLRYSLEERGCGMTVHSRISDLRSRGLNIEYRRVPGERARAHQYRLGETTRESEEPPWGSRALQPRSLGSSDPRSETKLDAGPVPSTTPEVALPSNEPAQLVLIGVAA